MDNFSALALFQLCIIDSVTKQYKAVRNSDQLYVRLGDKHELINVR